MDKVWVVEWGPLGSQAIVAYRDEINARFEADNLTKLGYKVSVRQVEVLRYYHGN